MFSTSALLSPTRSLVRCLKNTARLSPRLFTSPTAQSQVSISFIKSHFPLYYDGLTDVQKTDAEIVEFFEHILSNMESEYPQSYQFLQEQGLNKEDILLKYGEWRQALVDSMEQNMPAQSSQADIECYIKEFFNVQTAAMAQSTTGDSSDGPSEGGSGEQLPPPTGGDETSAEAESPTTTDSGDASTPDNIQYSMTPRQLINELDRFVIGQQQAKKAVAIAWRARWRRAQLEGDIQQEVMPKNILMVGPTGCGKTEVARRLARLSASPFVKVEATKFTEVGMLGRTSELSSRTWCRALLVLSRSARKKR